MEESVRFRRARALLGVMQDNADLSEDEKITYIEKVLAQHEQDTLKILTKEAHSGKA